ncbi:RNA-directed DNA polymerase, eukaryota, reverse transcriptase zinc-binding domain protein [Tanacetum coccineum]
MHNYHRNRGPPRCAFKIDIQKAYDTMDWRFLGCVLLWLPSTYDYVDYGLCHFVTSPLLFFNLNDDLFIFARGDLDSARVIMESLMRFKLTSGLIRGITWCNGEYKRGKAKVAWYDIYLPKCEDGLGLRTVLGRHLGPQVNEGPIGSDCVVSPCQFCSISFHLWLVMRNSLKTQDKLRQWDVGINTDLNLLRCSLCNTQSDSHAHLFFECPYSSKVWKLVRHLADMELVPPIFFMIFLLIFVLRQTRETLEAFW